MSDSTTAKPQSINIALVAYPGAREAALSGLEDLFYTANFLAQRDERYRQHFATQRIEQGEELLYKNDAQSTFDALLLPPSLQSFRLTPALASFVDGVKAQHARGALICSVCAGAFVLAETGLLNQRRATTHWDLAEMFQQRYPEVMLDTDKILIDNGDIMTAGGLTAWMDLGLNLIERFAGPSLMLAVARYFLVDPAGREQRHYRRFSPPMRHGDEAILKAQHWLQRHYSDSISVSQMAAQSTLSERTFLRRFQQATGYKPSEYLQQLRIDNAKEQLELSTTTVDHIAWNVGYQDSTAFRRTFTKIVGLTPTEFRKRFAVESMNR